MSDYSFYIFHFSIFFVTLQPLIKNRRKNDIELWARNLLNIRV